MKKFLAALVALSFITVFIVGCGTVASANSGSSNSGSNASSSITDVHLGYTTFLQSSVTINKGGSIKLIDDASSIHIISLGSWVNGKPVPAVERGAPQVNNVEVTNQNSLTIGPFTTAGTYHLYCSIHPGMNLTVIVK